MAGILSANLAVVNILPFPPLDGGRMLMITLKQLFGERISLRAERLTYVVGFVFLFAFLIWVTGFDIVRGLAAARSDRMSSPDALRPTRHATVSVDVGGVLVGAAHPVVVQSMTNTDTADADATAIQVARLAHAGSQLVRVTVNTEEAAAAVPEMVRKVRGLGVDVPIIGDFHYNGHKLLAEYPETAAALAKYRINPGNVGAKRHDEHFATIIRIADRQRQAGPDRGQLGLARPGDPDRADGRERALGRAARRARRDDRGDAPVGDALRRAGRGDRDAATTGSSCRPRSPASATSSTSTGCWPRGATTRSTSA